jgi:hypothetical protein
MKTHMLKTEFVVATQHLCLPVRPQSEWRMPAPNGVLPKNAGTLWGTAKNCIESRAFPPRSVSCIALLDSDVLNRAGPLDDFLDGIGRMLANRFCELCGRITIRNQGGDVSAPAKLSLR